MNDYQESVNKMILEVLYFFSDNNKLVDTNPILKKHVDALQVEVTKLKENHMVQRANKTGVYIDKANAKSEIAKLIFRLSSGLQSYGYDNKDYPLLASVDKSITKIKRLRDLDVPTYATIVIEALRKHEAQIVEYGISAKDIATLEAKKEEYKELLLKPREAIDAIAIATSNIKKNITKCLGLLRNNIDNDMQYYEKVDNDLYKLYFALRRITDNKTISLSIKGQVRDADTKKPLQYVVVTVKQEIKNKLHETKKITTKKGNYQFSHLPEGKCTVSFERNYYNTLVLKSQVHHDKFTRLNAEISREQLDDDKNFVIEN